MEGAASFVSGDNGKVSWRAQIAEGGAFFKHTRENPT
jgi:hypothetical protein